MRKRLLLTRLAGSLKSLLRTVQTFKSSLVRDARENSKRFSTRDARCFVAPWYSVYSKGQYYGYVSIRGEFLYCDCGVICRKCKVCLGCLRRRAVDTFTGEIEKLTCPLGGAHIADFETAEL